MGYSIKPAAVFAVFFVLNGIGAAECFSIDEDMVARFTTAYCARCHGGDEQEGDVRFDNFADLLPAEKPRFWHRVWRQLEAGDMPPQDSQQPTSNERKALLHWIEEQFGPVELPMDDAHWSLDAPVRPAGIALPNDSSTWAAIDYFVDQKLSEVGLTRSPVADRRTLLRRVTLDLTGLLPTPEETRAFVNDSDSLAVAYSRVVERLLESSRYGERWAQHWLDLVRWAETVGFETNSERRDAWHYRDWVIRSLNKDMPYDEFVTHQLLGDQTGQDAALGFLVSGPANLPGQIGRDEEAMRQARQDELDEVVQTVSQALFGLTVSCARCHDHKFDPISQRDYYAMQAIFAGLHYGTRRLRGAENDLWAAKVPGAREELARLKDARDALRVKWDLQKSLSDTQSEMFDPVLASAVRMEIDATTQGAASLYEFEIWSSPADGEPANVALASSGAIPSASSFALANQTRHFDNLVDGSVDARQAFPWVAEAAGSAWIQVELPVPRKIDRVVWYQGTSTPASYEIKVLDASSGQWKTVADTQHRLPRLDDSRPIDSITIDGLTVEQLAQLADLAQKIRESEQKLQRYSSGPQTYAASFSDSPDILHLLHRGDPMQPGDVSIAAVPAVLVSRVAGTRLADAQELRENPANRENPKIPQNPTSEVNRRRMLVEHLFAPNHPLTARVMVNRIWQHHFGTGLVKTASDFGRMGQPPSHPELLDWLAVEFVESGWSMKHMHRLIVQSATYMQTGRPHEKGISLDAQTRLLWRYPTRRLSAEAIRDSVLQASGKLNLAMYGRGFNFFNQRGGLADYRPLETFESDGWRRMVYAHKVRMQAVDVFGAFDCPDAGQMTPRRNRSITPIQALGLLNSPFMLRQAEFFAQRVQSEVGDDLQQSVQRAFEIAVSRLPTDAEEQALVTLAREHGIDQACRVIFNTSEFICLP